MTQTNTSTSQLQQVSLAKRMLIGAGIGLVLISIYLAGVHPNPVWGKLWMIRPLILMAFAGAMGGLCNYFIFYFRNQFSVNKTVAIILSIIVFIGGLFCGFVLGLDGTLWH